MKLEVSYYEIIKNLKKEMLITIINKFHAFCEVFNYPMAVEVNKLKKEDIINYLVDKQKVYLKFIIESLDYKTFKTLKKLSKKKINNTTSNDWNVLSTYGLVTNESIGKDTFILLKKYVSQKSAVKRVKENSKIYAIAEGIIVAYGVLPLDDFKKLLGNEENYKLVWLHASLNYEINEDKVISKKLSNKRKINKYCRDKNLKEFGVTDFRRLGEETYHHYNRQYKKLMHEIKSNYIFRKHDIMFLDSVVIIPYLYNNSSDEKEAAEALDATIEKYFEISRINLKNDIITKIKELKKSFPMWELRGYTISEVEK